MERSEDEIREENRSNLEASEATTLASQQEATQLNEVIVDEMQARRDQEYVQFVGENSPEDYTDGPLRFIETTDGVKDCVALLVTFDTSRKIIEASDIQRQYSRETRHAEEQMKEILRFESEVGSEILSHRARISQEESRDQEQETTSACIAKLRAELGVLENMLPQLDVRKQELIASINWRGGMLTEAYAAVAKQLDEAFVAGNLLAPDNEEEIPVEHFELQEEYQKAFIAEFGAEETSGAANDPPVLDTSREYLQANVVPPTPEEQAEINVRLALDDARERLMYAEQAFDCKDIERAQDWHVTQVRWQQGESTEDADQEAFDLRWYQTFQAITRELIEAEDENHQAMVAACKAGFQPDAMQEECFADLASDGRCDSEQGHDENFWLRFAAICKDDRKVNQWLDSLSEDLVDQNEAKQEPDTEDEWEARELEVWESQSTIASHALERRRIDQRQQEIDWQDRVRRLLDEDLNPSKEKGFHANFRYDIRLQHPAKSSHAGLPNLNSTASKTQSGDASLTQLLPPQVNKTHFAPTPRLSAQSQHDLRQLQHPSKFTPLQSNRPLIFYAGSLTWSSRQQWTPVLSPPSHPASVRQSSASISGCHPAPPSSFAGAAYRRAAENSLHKLTLDSLNTYAFFDFTLGYFTNPDQSPPVPKQTEMIGHSRQCSVGDADISPGDQSAPSTDLNSPLSASDAAPRDSSAEQVTNEASAIQARTDNPQPGQQANEPYGDIAAEQAARRKKYIRFLEEEESDYTQGPIRIVDAFDGVGNVASMLLNLDFSRKVQRVLQAQRGLRDAQQSAIGERHQWRDLQSQIMSKVAELNLRILMANSSSEVDHSEDFAEDVPHLRREVQKYEAFQTAVQQQSQLVEAHIQAQIDHLHACQASVNAYLEEAFVEARLMDPAPMDIEPVFDEMDLEGMFDQYCKQEQAELPDGDAENEGRSGDIRIRPAANDANVQDPAWQQKTQAQKTWYEAHLQLQKAQEAFDARTDDEWKDRQRAQEAQEAQEDSLEWSLRWIQRGRELTRALMEAEAEHEKAREAAQEAGVEVAVHDQKSQFRDHASDGYGSGYERGGIAQAPRERILDWVSLIPDAADPGKQESMPRPQTEVGSCEDMGVSQSRSVIDDGAQRRKIDSWSKACGRRGL
ncbi:hypothetical protein CERZMDRAFT_95325 [Cercospora zeae-maydis SCOH1-5]|uniref:Uncharacterized protein n=1 Tax=Cercospora zeae-maydis SCOH1-5 TaxID=717836 RepID=A0A6A6FNH3_9PEZI|nr:hypothetical protein CERZMDRAFT_95325 [Cercospora zeae-maydis SCOH1-5]